VSAGRELCAGRDDDAERVAGAAEAGGELGVVRGGGAGADHDGVVPVAEAVDVAAGRLAGSLLDQHLVDEVAWFVAPKLVGGGAAPGPVAGEGVARMADALSLDKMRVKRFGEDVALFGCLRRPAG
jgi:diaminohydroxyphosphoribosylaminopyrimidine deaminase/5-amino-6-(5-phosphoribosylamino)uracil reductase